MESRLFSFGENLRIFQLLVGARVRRIQIGSFVHPQAVLQMAHTEALIRHLRAAWGCPFVKGAAGNVPTEDAVHLFEAMGIETGIDLGKMAKVVEELGALCGRPLPGRMTRGLRAKGLVP